MKQIKHACSVAQPTGTCQIWLFMVLWTTFLVFYINPVRVPWLMIVTHIAKFKIQKITVISAAWCQRYNPMPWEPRRADGVGRLTKNRWTQQQTLALCTHVWYDLKKLGIHIPGPLFWLLLVRIYWGTWWYHLSFVVCKVFWLWKKEIQFWTWGPGAVARSFSLLKLTKYA